MRTILHTLGAALFGSLYVATWTAVHIGTIAAPPMGSGPSTIGPAAQGRPHEVRSTPTQRRHLPAPKIQISCPESPPPAGHHTSELPWVLLPAATAGTPASLLLIAPHPTRAPPLA